MRRAGFTLFEVLLATVLLGLMAVGVGRTLSSAARDTGSERDRAVAIRIADGHAARLLAAGPSAWDAADTVFSVDGAGAPDDEGRFLIEIGRSAECSGGLEPADNLAEPAPVPSACSGVRAVAVYVIRVGYPTGTGTSAVERRIFIDPYAVYTSEISSP